ncbi:TPA: transposase [Escherichia coli]|nr:transposase [Escherichia coli]
MPAFEWVHVQLHQQKGMISLSPPTICNSAVKCQFGFVKARYKGLAKNDSQLAMLFTLANLVRVDQLIRAQARST